VVKGALSGSEDLTIEGLVEGTIELKQNILTIGQNAKITAQIEAKAVVIHGDVRGNITATDKIEIRETASVDGDVVAPRVAISEGAHFRGSIDMQRSTDAKAGAKPAESKPAASPAPPTPPTGAVVR
jgi:cytoskeletal protein CcmA (bactofilin family)